MKHHFAIVASILFSVSPVHAGTPRPLTLAEVKEAQIERTFHGLEARCKRMTALQITVQNGTNALHQHIEARLDKKAGALETLVALQLAEQQNAMIRETNKIIGLLNADPSVAFPEVFEHVRTDMRLVEARLRKADVGRQTQELQADIVTTLTEMVTGIRFGR